MRYRALIIFPFDYSKVMNTSLTGFKQFVGRHTPGASEHLLVVPVVPRDNDTWNGVTTDTLYIKCE